MGTFGFNRTQEISWRIAEILVHPKKVHCSVMLITKLVSQLVTKANTHSG
jgi:hypothetical protein